jgi:hypothetical protein
MYNLFYIKKIVAVTFLPIVFVRLINCKIEVKKKGLKPLNAMLTLP